MKRVLFIIIGLWVSLTSMWAQDLVYLEHCETLSFDQRRLPDAQLLKGNVRFRHEDALMYCDSAYFYDKSNSLDAFGHVRFVQGDTLEGVGEILHYDGNTRLARLHRNVVLTHITTVLKTDSMHYDRVRNLAYYFTGGTIIDDDNLLTSVWGSYNMSNKDAEFSHDVHLQNQSATMDADSLVYNTSTNVAKLVSPTTIVYEDETTVLSSDGWYNTSTERSMLLSRSIILHQDGKNLTGDTIYYDHKAGLGNVFGHMAMTDTVQKATLYGNYGIMYEKEERGYATDSAYLLDWSREKKTYVHADTIFSETVPYQIMLVHDTMLVDTLIQQDTLTIDTLCIDTITIDSIRIDTIVNSRVVYDTTMIDTTYNRVRAYFHVRAYSDDFQFVCDSMVYCGRDSIITMYHEPVCWSQQFQASADTIFIFVNDSTIDHLYGAGSALGIKQEGEGEYDQLSGKEMTAYVREGELKEVHVKGNAETVYFPRNDDSTYIGVNKTQSSYVTLYIENNKLHHVLFTTETTGTLYPLSQIRNEDTRLLGFFWAKLERPTSPESIFFSPVRTARPVPKAMSASDFEEEEEVVVKKEERRNRKKK